MARATDRLDRRSYKLADKLDALGIIKDPSASLAARIRAWDYLRDIGASLAPKERDAHALAERNIRGELEELGGAFNDGRQVYRVINGKIRGALP